MFNPALEVCSYKRLLHGITCNIRLQLYCLWFVMSNFVSFTNPFGRLLPHIHISITMLSQKEFPYQSAPIVPFYFLDNCMVDPKNKRTVM